MKILVALKRVADFKTSARVKADGSAVDTANVKMIINPFDEIALEEALRLKEQGRASEVVVVTIGPLAAQENLRTALAMGADRGILVQTDLALQALTIAKMLAKIVAQENPNLVIMGKQAVDSDNNQTGQMLAALLNWPQATFASKLTLSATHAEVTREIDGGLETLQLTLPALITTDLRLNDPRYISLPNIMQAKRKTIDTIQADSFGLALASKLKILKLAVPEKKRAAIRVDSAAELVRRLKEEAKVL